MTNNYGELFCQAVDEIVKKRLEGIAYDSTILCTIVDDSKKEDGIYIVSNGSAKFEAVSAVTSYTKGNSVYVQIPGGDMKEQKIIIAKKNDKNDVPYTYQRPFSNLVDITGNLISSNIDSKQTGLRANAFTEGIADPYDDREQSVTLWTYNAYDEQAIRNEEGSAFSSFTRLGIQGSFQSWLNPFYITGSQSAHNVVKGDYGLRLRVYTVEETVSTDSDNKEAYYDMYLSCSDMNGNPYNFQTFYQQEKVFDISAIGTIQKMELQFYQRKGSFVDAEGEEIPFKDFLENYVAPNIYLKDPYITLGYDINEFDEEMVQIYTFDSTKYNATANPLTNNHKEVHLRWIHKLDDGTFTSVTEKTDFDYEVRWYKYELGHSSADEYSGVYWKNLSVQRSSGGSHVYEILDDKWKKENENNSQAYQRHPNFFSSWMIPDITMQTEQIKAIIIYNGKPYRSNILACENEREVVNKATIEAVQALSIQCADKWLDEPPIETRFESNFGNYRIYKQNGQLIDQAQAQHPRTFIAYFKSFTGSDDVAPTPLVEATSIEWIIPVKNSMITIKPEDYGPNVTLPEDSTDGLLHIVRGSDSSGKITLNSQRFYIKSHYTQMNSNNTIQCKVNINNTIYTATQELTFGTAGTTGTDCTFILDFDNGVTAVTNQANSAVTITARLYDYENKEVPLDGKTIAWDWKVSDGLLTHQSIPDAPGYKREVKRNAAWTESNYNILQASLPWGNTTLIAYLPIPIRSSDTYAYISGATQVIYDSNGEISDLYRDPYRIYNSNAQQVNPATVKWSVLNANSNENGIYTPTMTERDGNYTLKPLDFYVQGACEKVCVVGKIGNTTIWSQPLLLLQNKYPSAMVNAWDGKLLIDEEKGAILAPRLTAGKKETDNSFSGIMLGNWGDQNVDNSLSKGATGLYGFDHGEQTYAFKQDGTAFIGKSGAGRIEFDGSEGVIESSSYQAGQGMSINLKNGTIDAHQFTLNAGGTTPTAGQYGTIFISSNLSDTPLQIGRNFEVNWNGDLIANNATFESGTFYGDIYASGGELGNLTVTGTLTGGYISGSTISGGYINGSAISGGTITGGDISGGTISGSAIDGGTITGGTISGSAISGGSITGGAISGGTIDGSSVTGASISGGTITGGAISGGTISGSAISGGSITGGAISGGTIDGGAITGGTISGSTISGASISGGTITGGSISGGSISIGSGFSVSSSSVSITGAITATSGKIGNWSISSGAITNGTTTTLASNGKITATNIDISGSSSKINGVTISSCNITSCNVTDNLVFDNNECNLKTLYYGYRYYTFSTTAVVKSITYYYKTIKFKEGIFSAAQQVTVLVDGLEANTVNVLSKATPKWASRSIKVITATPTTDGADDDSSTVGGGSGGSGAGGNNLGTIS